MDENEKIIDKELWRKIALRFLKETGLYKKWIEYIHYLQIEKPPTTEYVTSETWFKKPMIDNIFGHSRFTNFIRNNSNYSLPAHLSISDLFRMYLREMYGTEKFNLYIKAIGRTSNATFDKERGIAKINFIKKTN